MTQLQALTWIRVTIQCKNTRTKVGIYLHPKY